MKDATQYQQTSISASKVLLAKLAAARRKHVSVSAGTGAGIAVGTFIILLAAIMLVDWWLDLPLAIRGVLLAGLLAVIGYLLWRFVVTPIRNQPDDDTVALAVEKAFPQFRSRLISSIQFPRPGVISPSSAASLARMTISETEAFAAPLDFTEVVSTRDFKKVIGWAVSVIALALFAFMYGGEVSRDLLKRAFLSSMPVPRHTRVELVTGDRVVGRGDAVRIEAFARGVVPRTGTLTVKSSGRRTQDYVMEKEKEGRFSRTLENVQQTFTYVVQLNDGTTRSHRIDVVPRPGVATIECEQIYPAYTGLKNTKRPLGDLTLLAGSKLQIAVTTTKDVKSALIRFAGITNDIPLKVDAAKPRELRGEFDVVRGLTGFSVELVDTGGMESRDSAVYRVDVVPDRVPKLRIVAPDRKEELVTAFAVQPISFEASDDFEIVKARLRYKVGETEQAEVQTIDFQMPTNIVKSRFSGHSMTNQYLWAIRDFQPPLPEGTRVEFWVEVQDNNNVTGPGIGTTEHQLLRVVSESEKRADLLNRAGDYLGTISDVTGDQEKLNLRLGEIILERRTP